MKRDTNRHLLRSSLLGCFAFLLLLNTASAQTSPYRATESLYFKARVGLNTYGGDRDNNPDGEFQEYIERIGFSLSTEVGYHFSHSFDLGLIHISGVYPRIDENETADGVPYLQPFYETLDPDQTSEWRHSLSLIGRLKLWSKKRISPYAQLGLSLGFGKINDSIETGFGPIGGFGLDIAASDRVGIFLEVSSGYYYGDEKLDASDPDAFGDVVADVSEFDALDFYSIGLRYTVKLPFVPVTVDCVGPTTLIPGESGTYAANINPDATQPVDVHWDFGDGATASGRGPHQHAFANPDSVERAYNVTVTASNGKSTDTAVCPVKILARPRCAIRAIPDRFDTCEQPLPPVQFRSTVTGTLPITYRWDFGEPGATSTQAEPLHIYPRTDLEPRITRTATLSVSNTAGSATCTAQVDIACPCHPDLILPVRFARHDSVIPGQARQNLQDNLGSLRANPLTIVVVEGSAQSEERNAQALADDRARAVAQFYIQGGIDRRRIVIIGLVKRKGAVADPFSTQTRLFCDRSELDKHLAEQRQQFQEQD